MLYIVATPIGNLADISLRALEVLKSVDIILCEDTRHSCVLLNHYGIHGKQLWAYHDHNETTQRERVLQALIEGKDIALICDAGTPMIADPGYKLIQLLNEHNIPVTSLPGASAVITALTLSGLPCDQFYFGGFFDWQRYTQVVALESTLVFYESPNRIIETLSKIQASYSNRQIAVVRELTKRFETVVKGSIDEVIDTLVNTNQCKGEMVLILGAPDSSHDQQKDIEWQQKLEQFIKQGQPIKDICTLISKTYGIHRKTVYAKALEFKENNS